MKLRGNGTLKIRISYVIDSYLGNLSQKKCEIVHCLKKIDLHNRFHTRKLK